MSARGTRAAAGEEQDLSRLCPFCGAAARAVPDGSGWRLSVAHGSGCYLSGHVGRWYDSLGALRAEWEGPDAGMLPPDAQLCLVFAVRWSMTLRTASPRIVASVVARAVPRPSAGYARIVLDDIADARDRAAHGWSQPGLHAFEPLVPALSARAAARA